MSENPLQLSLQAIEARLAERESATPSQQDGYGVASIGMPAEDIRALQSTFRRVARRRLSYRLTGLREGVDILLVNADEPGALARWVRYRGELGTAREPASVVISRNRSFTTRHYQMRGPLSIEATLGMLDHVAENALGAEPENALLPLASPDAAPTASVLPVRVLVVDDSLPVRVQMQQALRPLVAQIDFAADGEAGLALWEQHHYDLVFLDVYLPGIDGYVLCEHIKDRAADVPVVMLTSASTPADRSRSLLAGCDTYLIKPVTPGMLRDLLEQYLGDRRTEASA
jgi:two-component system, cell cycle response regulator